MNKPTLAAFLKSKPLLFILFTLSLAACNTFPKGYRYLTTGEPKKAADIFKKHNKSCSAKYGPAALYYYEGMNQSKADSMPEWIRLHNLYCEMEDCVKNLPDRKRLKLAKYGVTPARIKQTRNDFESTILEYLCASGTIADLDSLYSKFPCWENKGGRDSVRAVIVNMTINPDQVVYEKKCRDWRSQTSTPTVIPGKGRPCTVSPDWTIRYDDATAIIKRYSSFIIAANYPSLWGIQEHIWDIYRNQYSFCDMGRFKIDHPTDRYAKDCWFETARDTLCLGLLQPLLAFHRNNASSVLDVDICNQILCLDDEASDRNALNAEERKQVEDVRMMAQLQQQFICKKVQYDSIQLISKVEYLAKKYPQHWAVYTLAREMANYFYTTGRLPSARQAEVTLKPLFPDKEVCPTNYDFQVGKQQWFTLYDTLLAQTGDTLKGIKQISAWNTTENDEYSLVSWGENEEVFFVRKHRATGYVQVMRSVLVGGVWSKPTPVHELSISNDVVPLSITDDGRMMLLRSGGQLLQSFRHELKRPWSRPDPLPMTFKFSGKAVFSPDASMLLLEDYATSTSALSRPRKDIFVSMLGNDGRYGPKISIGNKINQPGSDEGSPYLVSGGRMLLFTSNRHDALGYNDVFGVSLSKSGDWTTAETPVNMGLQINTIFEDNGLTYYSEYTGGGYFDRRDQCTGDLGIWGVEPKIIPEKIIRLAGLVLNENRKPITGGFIEFATDYNLRTPSRLVSAKGAYAFTAPDSTQVIRLFPEIPGYYSERDTTHFLATVPKGQIVRDTFVLTSFEYIRQNFKLRYSTFINGTAQFDNPEKAFPEFTRLAKIATRMGAEIELTGHTDSIGTETINQKLSMNRAESVKQFLVEKCGFPSAKIKVFAFGATKPICSNATEEGKRCNRRIEVAFRMPELPSVKEGGVKKEVGSGRR